MNKTNARDYLKEQKHCRSIKISTMFGEGYAVLYIISGPKNAHELLLTITAGDSVSRQHQRIGGRGNSRRLRGIANAKYSPASCRTVSDVLP